jgi:hypothetical protein
MNQVLSQASQSLLDLLHSPVSRKQPSVQFLCHTSLLLLSNASPCLSQLNHSNASQTAFELASMLHDYAYLITEHVPQFKPTPVRETSTAYFQVIGNDTLQYILSFCSVDELFGQLKDVSRKFRQLCVKLQWREVSIEADKESELVATRSQFQDIDESDLITNAAFVEKVQFNFFGFPQRPAEWFSSIPRLPKLKTVSVFVPELPSYAEPKWDIFLNWFDGFLKTHGNSLKTFSYFANSTFWELFTQRYRVLQTSSTAKLEMLTLCVFESPIDWIPCGLTSLRILNSSLRSELPTVLPNLNSLVFLELNHAEIFDWSLLCSNLGCCEHFQVTIQEEAEFGLVFGNIGLLPKLVNLVIDCDTLEFDIKAPLEMKKMHMLTSFRINFQRASILKLIRQVCSNAPELSNLSLESGICSIDTLHVLQTELQLHKRLTRIKLTHSIINDTRNILKDFASLRKTIDEKFPSLREVHDSNQYFHSIFQLLFKNMNS